MSNEFNQSLSNFMTDFASGGAIRHLTDNGYTIDEIMKRLDYPIPKEKVAEIVFKYYIDEGHISLTEPVSEIKKTSFVTTQDRYGKTSIRQTVERINIRPDDYMACDYGWQIYQNGAIEEVNKYEDRIQKHILLLPWPLQRVWIKKDLFKIIINKSNMT